MNDIAIVDIDSLLYYAVHPNKVLDSSGNPTKKYSNAGNLVFEYKDKTEEEVISSCKYLITEILVGCKAKEYIGFVAGSNTTKNKSEINPDYKANRVKEKPKLIDFAKQYFIDNYNIFKVDNLEVDDCVHIYRLNTPNSFICCIDSDIINLEGLTYNWKKKEWNITDLGLATKKFWTTIITGSHNNNKGLKGRGIKFVDTIFPISNNDFELSQIVFKQYLKDLGIDEGIKQFYSNYICTKILEKSDNFDVTKYNTKSVMSIF